MNLLTASEIDCVIGAYNDQTTGTRIPGGSYYGLGETGDPSQIAGVLGNGLPPPPTFAEAPRDPDGPPSNEDPDGSPTMFG